MSTGENANRIYGLFKSLSNPPFFLYRICHYLNWFVPNRLASYIYKRNKKDYKHEDVSDFLLDTFDGSGQAVHPDMAFFEGQYWLAVTPYPYGMEDYENPCIYQGNGLSDLLAPDGPIAIQHIHKRGVHLSDPCFAIKGNTLYCYYRESERKGDKEEHCIWGVQYDGSIKGWCKPVLLMRSVEDKILSPAMLYDESGKLIIFYVSSKNDPYSLVYTYGNGTIDEIAKCDIAGLPEDYYLWHIGIKKVEELNPAITDSRELVGLFLMKSIKAGGGMKLFEARSNGMLSNWIAIKVVEMPEEIKDVVTFPYKSCYIPNGKGDIMLSFRDKKSRNRLVILNGKR